MNFIRISLNIIKLSLVLFFPNLGLALNSFNSCLNAFNKNYVLSAVSFDYAYSEMDSKGKWIIHPDKVLVSVIPLDSDNNIRNYYRMSEAFYFRDSVAKFPFPINEYYIDRGLNPIIDVYSYQYPQSFSDRSKIIEKSLPLDRSNILMINRMNINKESPQFDQSVGYLRIFDGSKYDSGPRSESNQKLYLEKLFEYESKSTSFVNELRNKGYYVYELGKYFIDKDLSPSDKKLVRDEIRKWVYGFLSELSETELAETVFLAHVLARSNRILYEREYGFKPVDRNKSRGLELEEDILEVNGLDLFNRLKLVYNVP